MATTDYASGAPPFPPETVDGWAIEWVRKDFGPGPRNSLPSVAIVIVATKGERVRRNAAQFLDPSDGSTAIARRLLLSWLKEVSPE